MKAYFFLIAALAAGDAHAQAFVLGPRGCDVIEGYDAGGAIYSVDQDLIVLTPRSLEGIEWFCAFEPAFYPYPLTPILRAAKWGCAWAIAWNRGRSSSLPFTLMDRRDGTVQLDASGWSEPLILEICRGP